MERGPLPPHERTWRHPSEIAAAERAELRSRSAAASTRVFALTTGTLGLLAVGVLILTVTPRRQESPIAISATTSTAIALDGARADTRVSALASPTRESVNSARRRRIATPALATPIGDGELAVVTRAALHNRNTRVVDVVLPSGAGALAEVVYQHGDALVVAIDSDDPEPGHTIARHRPHDRDMVTVMASPPVAVAYGDVDELDVDEGTAVLDGDGSLVAVCSRSRDERGTRLIEITEAIAGTTSAER